MFALTQLGKPTASVLFVRFANGRVFSFPLLARAMEIMSREVLATSQSVLQWKQTDAGHLDRNPIAPAG